MNERNKIINARSKLYEQINIIMESLEDFIWKINNFLDINKSQQIDFFFYYIQTIEEEIVTPQLISECFNSLHIEKYSNISQYLSSKSRTWKGKKFIKKEVWYALERKYKEVLEKEIWTIKVSKPHNGSIVPYSLFENTRGYLKKIIHQAIICYDNQAYDGCSILLRKVLEILIIECFEKHSIKSRIQDNNWDFLYLSNLISLFTNATEWSVWRNAKKSLKSIKNLWDLAAHNRRFITQKSDLDKIQDDMRIVFEELIHLNYC